MVAIVVEIDSKEALDALRQASKQIGNTRLLMENLGEALLNTTLERMDNEEAPDGQKWQRLNSAYASSKRSNKILQEQGMASGLKGSLHYAISGNELRLGSDKIYAAIHQFGGEIKPVNGDYLTFKMGGGFIKARKVTIPARPYLGVGPNEEQAIINVAKDLLNAAF